MTGRISGFYELCKIGNLTALIEYVELYRITAKYDRSECNYAFRCACSNDHLHIAQWLVEYFGLTVEDACAYDNYAFRWACSNGHLDVAQWLAEHFGLTAKDARSDNNFAFRWACEEGHLHIAQWLIERFGLTKKDVWDFDKEIVDQLDWEPSLGPKSAVKLT